MSSITYSPADLIHGAFSVKVGDKSSFGYLIKAKDVYPHVDQETKDTATVAPFPGTPDDYLAHHNNDASIQKQMKNKVKKCPSCSKAVAFTLHVCNQCGADLSTVPISFTNNVFTGFIYGIEKGPFPFTVSARLQTEEYLVFDDLLALTPCHINVIPTTKYIPDMRYLLKRPKEGKKIVDELFENCFKVLKDQFFGNAAWRKKLMRDSDAVSEAELRLHVASGFNYPPSQYQLHLQFMLPPFLPFQYYQYLKGVHFTYGRFVPIEYVKKVLDLDIPYDVQDETPIEDIFKFYKEKGVDYDVIHKECYDRYGASHKRFADWTPEDFEVIGVDGKAYKFDPKKDSADQEVQEDINQVTANDKVLLQNYGRPYNANKPTGSYYKHAKKASDIDVWA